MFPNQGKVTNDNTRCEWQLMSRVTVIMGTAKVSYTTSYTGQEVHTVAAAVLGTSVHGSDTRLHGPRRINRWCGVIVVVATSPQGNEHHVSPLWCASPKIGAAAASVFETRVQDA